MRALAQPARPAVEPARRARPAQPMRRRRPAHGKPVDRSRATPRRHRSSPLHPALPGNQAGFREEEFARAFVGLLIDPDFDDVDMTDLLAPLRARQQAIEAEEDIFAGFGP